MKWNDGKIKGSQADDECKFWQDSWYRNTHSWIIPKKLRCNQIKLMWTSKCIIYEFWLSTSFPAGESGETQNMSRHAAGMKHCITLPQIKSQFPCKSSQKANSCKRMRRLMCIAFFLLAVSKETNSKEIPTKRKVEEIEQELDKVFCYHHHNLHCINYWYFYVEVATDTTTDTIEQKLETVFYHHHHYILDHKKIIIVLQIFSKNATITI